MLSVKRASRLRRTPPAGRAQSVLGALACGFAYVQCTTEVGRPFCLFCLFRFFASSAFEHLSGFSVPGPSPPVPVLHRQTTWPALIPSPPNTASAQLLPATLASITSLLKPELKVGSNPLGGRQIAAPGGRGRRRPQRPLQLSGRLIRRASDRIDRKGV